MSDAWLRVLSAAGVAVVVFAVFLVAERLLRKGFRRIGGRSPLLAELAEHASRPLRVFAALVILRATVFVALPRGAWTDPAEHAMTLALIASGAWLLTGVLLSVEQTVLSRLRVDERDNRHARRVQTQITLVRRVTVAGVAVLALGAMLMTFPGARAAGASLLASAGVIGAIAALAAQSLLGNVFAGLQIAFSDAIRLDDVVIVEGEWGRIEDITLTYLVVHIWDDRRLVIPTSHFMSNPFENWTRREAALLGTVEVDVDWAMPVEEMRAELRAILDSTDLWDGRTCVLQVTDAVNTLVRVRALVSAADAPTLFDLRCLVRERLVAWARSQHPYALPRLRSERVSSGHRPRQEGAVATEHTEPDQDARLFGDSPDGRVREHAFTGRER
ncbi:mechanosensitive ion channel family protein [Actinokineospora bangkokensis]|uniref:Mechanosensitive ion channel protein MscS n=1 Tax=Actinokineospora bangkokensis TaxID=1193682 RepID=A0A1Q9LPP3_9PSEU|nr:mechanosensitive ion channel domain-containing protein [Actinokineospora bangkokensis]OLR93998.1 mechanosensitive ion channel protein MscS [Actinokineospora bangkokensis]